MSSNNNKVYKIDIRTNIDIYNKLDELVQYHNISKTKLVERAIIEMYDKDILSNDICPDTKQECMVHMCKIVNHANAIADDDIRKNILEEANEICQILK